MPRTRGRSALCNEREIVRERFVSDGLLIGFVKPKKTAYKNSLTTSNTSKGYVCLPVKKDNINKHFQEPLRDVCKATVGHTQHRWATQARPRAAGHLCRHPGAGPTMLHSEMVHGVGKKPQLAQLPTKWTQSPISKRTESGPHLPSADPIRKGNKKGNTTKNKKPTQPQ